MNKLYEDIEKQLLGLGVDGCDMDPESIVSGMLRGLDILEDLIPAEDSEYHYNSPKGLTTYWEKSKAWEKYLSENWKSPELEFVVKNEYEDHISTGGYEEGTYILKRHSVFKYKGQFYKAVWVDYSTYEYELESLKVVEPVYKTVTVYEGV